MLLVFALGTSFCASAIPVVKGWIVSQQGDCYKIHVVLTDVTAEHGSVFVWAGDVTLGECADDGQSVQAKKSATATLGAEKTPISVFPNPVTTGKLQFSRPLTGILTDIFGRTLLQFKETGALDVSSLAPGLYLLHGADFTTQKIYVK